MSKQPSPAAAVDLTTLSPSRIRVADTCGRKFEYQYVRRLPSPGETGALIFGNVIHDSVHAWYGDDESPADHKRRSLVEIVTESWPSYLPAAVWRAVERVIDAEREAEAVAQFLVATQGYKAPRQTKAFLSSDAAKQTADAREALLACQAACETIRWPKDEDAFRAFERSRAIAGKLQQLWQPLPRPLAVERAFTLQFEGYQLRGRLDQVRADPRPGTGVATVDLLDIKTGREPLSQMEAFLQSWMYDKAAQAMPDLPDPDYVVFWLARHHRGQRGRVRPEHDKLALEILNGVARRIISGSHEPHYGFWCDRCDFQDLCAAEIGLWPVDSDTLVLE